MDSREDRIISVGAVPSRQVLERAVAVLERGGLVAYPTRCIYGLGADALNAGAVVRVYRVKQRPAGKPLSILIPNRQDLENWAAGVSPAAVRLMDRFWPGKVTFVFTARPGLPPELLGGTGRIGIRLPAHPVAAALVEAFGRPLTATSANLSGEPGSVRVEDFSDAVLRQVDLILDAGPLEGGAGSTVVDVTGEVPVVLREGVVAARRITAAWRVGASDGID